MRLVIPFLPMRAVRKRLGQSRENLLAGAAVSVFAFALYLFTLAPTVLYYDLPDLRDVATLQTKVAILGVPDYTGYPTWVILAHLFTYLPFGDEAYRANLSSAVFAAFAVFFVFLCAHRLTGRTAAAAGGALAFAVGDIFWSQALVAEVYTLNALFIALIIYVVLLWRDARRDRYLLLTAFLIGLSLTHHLTSGLLLPAALLFIGLVEPRKLLEWRLLLKGTGLFLIGLLPYLYIPIRTSMDYLPQGWVWGQPLVREYPPNTLYGFYNLISGGLWKERMWAFGPRELPERLLLYLDYLYGSNAQMHLGLVLVAIFGFFLLIYRDLASGAMLGFLYAGWLFHALEYDIEDIYYYFIPTYLILALFLAVGFGALFDVLGRSRERLPAPELLAVVLAVSVILLPLLGARETYRKVDMSEDYHGREITAAIAEKVKRGAAVLHHRSPLDYMILVEGRRTDIEPIAYIEAPDPPGIVRATRALRERPVYILFPGRETTPYYLGVEDSERLYRRYGYDLVEVDREVLLYEVVRREGSG
ncbi:MAG: DUF2723 domain-containing protein [Actinomycetota bacterium]